MSARPIPWPRVLVVFSGHADLWWLRLLKPGFRHCFVVLGAPGGWLLVEAKSHCTDIRPLPVGPDFDLAGYYRERGMRVVETHLRTPPRRPAPWRPYTCVEAVKRVLGLHAGRILTPWDLHKFLSTRK